MTRRRKLNDNPIYRDIVLKNLEFLTLEDDACSPGADRALFDRYISYLEFRYDQTDNPCFVWDAIHLSYQRAVDEYRVAVAGSAEQLMALSRERQVDLQNQAANHVRDSGLVLPSWCISYLVRVAGEISTISDGLDFSQFRTNRAEGFMASFSEWSRHPTLTREQAAQRISGILGFTRRGKNAFDQKFSERVDLNMEQIFRNQIMRGMPRSRIYAAMANVLRLNERAVQKRISNGRKLVEDLRRFLSGDHD